MLHVVSANSSPPITKAGVSAYCRVKALERVDVPWQSGVERKTTMMHSQTNDTGTFGPPTQQEIAMLVKELRAYFGWKQLALAAEAGVTERTVERTEAGVKVSDDTLRKIAKALKLRERAFTDMYYHPSDKELMAEVERIRDENTVTHLHDLSQARDLENILGQHGHLIDGNAVEDSLTEAVASLKDQIQDWGDILDDIPHRERLAACRSLLESIREIEERGYTARWGHYTTDDKFTVGVLVFFRTSALETSEHFRRAIVPRWLMRNVLS
jgi:transcriptional regulator with XRE-family HTH domain